MFISLPLLSSDKISKSQPWTRGCHLELKPKRSFYSNFAASRTDLLPPHHRKQLPNCILPHEGGGVTWEGKRGSSRLIEKEKIYSLEGTEPHPSLPSEEGGGGREGSPSEVPF